MSVTIGKETNPKIGDDNTMVSNEDLVPMSAKHSNNFNIVSIVSPVTCFLSLIRLSYLCKVKN